MSTYKKAQNAFGYAFGMPLERVSVFRPKLKICVWNGEISERTLKTRLQEVLYIQAMLPIRTAADRLLLFKCRFMIASFCVFENAFNPNSRCHTYGKRLGGAAWGGSRCDPRTRHRAGAVLSSLDSGFQRSNDFLPSQQFFARGKCRGTFLLCISCKYHPLSWQR